MEDLGARKCESTPAVALWHLQIVISCWLIVARMETFAGPSFETRKPADRISFAVKRSLSILKVSEHLEVRSLTRLRPYIKTRPKDDRKNGSRRNSEWMTYKCHIRAAVSGYLCKSASIGAVAVPLM